MHKHYICTFVSRLLSLQSSDSSGKTVNPLQTSVNIRLTKVENSQALLRKFVIKYSSENAHYFSEECLSKFELSSLTLPAIGWMEAWKDGRSPSIHPPIHSSILSGAKEGNPAQKLKLFFLTCLTIQTNAIP